ncbi:MAG: PEP-CTERM sorting domain-containing protein, partial [Pseudomonadota bacterium]
TIHTDSFTRNGYADAFNNSLNGQNFYYTSGSMDYTIIDGLDSYSGTFTYANQRYGSTAFNSSVMSPQGTVSVFLWGGDADSDRYQTGIGVDLGITLTPVPEPGALVLLGLGLLGLGFKRKVGIKA